MARHADTRFYVRPGDVSENDLTLVGDEARHLSKVLRMRPGDLIEAVDGEGNWFRAELTSTGRDEAYARVLERAQGIGEPRIHLTMGLAPLKNPSRFEVFLEKAVELGVSRIVPLVTERTERTTFKATRAVNILVAAMKQCGRSRLPEISDPVPLASFITGCEAEVRLICHEASGSDAALVRQLRPFAPSMCVLVGPEGGFTTGEVDEAVTAGFRVVSLGPRRLRAETAAIVAATAVMLSEAAG